MKTRRAYTIIELLMVVAVISILLTLIFKGISGSLYAARERRTETLLQVVRSGIDAYRAYEGQWPQVLQNHVESGNFPGENKEASDVSNRRTHDPNVYVLPGDEVREMVKTLVDEAKKGNALIDISALFVSRDTGKKDGKGFGLDFTAAVHGTRTSRRKMSTSQMYFGYPDKETGHFRRFKMVYAIPTDTLTVREQDTWDD